MDRPLPNEEMKAAMDKAHAKGLPVVFHSDPAIGIVSAREETPEETAERRRKFSEKFYPDFRSKDLPPISNNE